VLVISSIGYVTQEIRVGNQTEFNIEMEPDVQQLSEVVVVGYGTQKKRDITSAVASVGGEAIAERGTVSPLQAVQGQVAGVDISAGSGRAGAGFDIQIRGQNSLATGQKPLFVVDGVIVDDIDFLNPQDIESLDVLKDASSTAVYGSRGSNGVVQITTKRGTSVKEGATISYDGYAGVRQNVRHPDFMGGDEWFRYRQNAFIVQNLNSGNYDQTSGGLANAPYITARRVALKEYTDWPDHFLQTGTQQNHWLNVSGTSNNNKMNYVIGGGYQEETGNLLKDWFNRYNFKANFNHQLSERWSAGMSFNFSLTETERGSQSAVTNAYRMSPLASPYDSLGNLLYQPAKYGDVNYTSSVNPLIDNANSEDNTRRIYGIGNLYLQYSPVEWMDLRTTFSPQVRSQRRGRFWGSETEARNLRGPAADMRTSEFFSYIWDNQIMLRKTFNEVHSFNLDGLYSMQYDRSEFGYILAEDLPYNSLFYNLGSADLYREVASGFNQVSLISYMARMNYSFKDKYLLTLTTRWDGSSKLAEGYKWATFPSASLGWRVSEEGFMKNSNVFYNLMARVSYGFTGNNNIDPYSTMVMATDPTWYDFGGGLARGFAPSGVVNNRLTWERTRELNFGVDYDLFQGRISGSVDAYDRESSALLMDRELPRETGWTSMVDNVGSVRNRGIELSLRTINFQSRDFRWTTTFNFARNRNQILELLGGQEDMPGNQWFIGQPINVNYTYIWDGVWQESEREEAEKFNRVPGQVKIRDISGPEGVPDGKIDPAYDYTIIGSPMPDWTGGFSTQLSYKGFDFSASLFTRQGVQVLSPFHREFTNVRDRGRAKLSMDYYMPENGVTPENITNQYPRPMDPGTEYDDVAYYQDASFVKVQNMVLGYTFAPEMLERVRLRNLRLYFNVLNPFVFTEYTGFDPEWAHKGLESTGNASVTYQMGVNLKF
jgi:TonB-linked SusC/RagA family outer membrane protein